MMSPCVLLHDHVDEKALAVFRHAVGEAARAPPFGFLDLAAVFGGGMFERGHDLVDLFLRRGGPADEDQVVYAFFHVCDDSVSQTSSTSRQTGVRCQLPRALKPNLS